MSQITETARQILDEVFAITGQSFHSLNDIKAKSSTEVRDVLVHWVPLVDINHRNAIYSVFNSQVEKKYLHQMIGWWSTEKVDQCLELLAQVLVRQATEDNATILLESCIPLRKNYTTLILCALAKFKSTGRTAKHLLIERLSEPDVALWECYRIGMQVNDPAITRWFEEHRNTQDARLRKIVRMVLMPKKQLPKSVVASAQPPDLKQEMYSAETDSDDVGSVLRMIASKFEVKVPRSISGGSFLRGLEMDCWAYADVEGKDGVYQLWFRMEDPDVAHIVLLKCGAVESSKGSGSQIH